MNQREKHFSKNNTSVNFNVNLKNSNNIPDKETIVQNLPEEPLTENCIKESEIKSNNISEQFQIDKEELTDQSNNSEKKTSTEDNHPKKDKVKPKAKRLGLWSAILAAMFVASIAVTNVSNNSLFHENPISTSEGAQEILKQRWSDKLELGARLIKNDDQVTLEPVDMTFTHDKADETTKMWVWDFAAEDGDYVHILVDGKPISEPFMIKNKPVSFDVSKNSVISVIGVRDGGGGITYAIHVEAIGQTYLNAAGINQANTYTMHYEPVMK